MNFNPFFSNFVVQFLFHPFLPKKGFKFSTSRPQHYWNREQQFPVEEKPLITPRQTETTSSAQSSYENTYTNSLRSYTSDAAGYPSTGKSQYPHHCSAS